MVRLRRRCEGWAVSPTLIAACILAVFAGVVVVRIGVDEQHHRTIPAVSSATVAVERPGQPTARGVLTRDQASDLVRLINRLPQAPSDGGCAATSGDGEVITFLAAAGPITVDVTCTGVDISSHGHDWGANKIDGDGVIDPALQRDLPNLPWARLDRASP